MAKGEKYVTDLNYLYFGGHVQQAFLGNKEAMQMYLGSKKVFNRALYSVETKEALIPAEGVEDFKGLALVSSIKKDYDGKLTDIPYTITPTRFDANETDEDKTGEYTIEQEVSHLVVKGTYRQTADKLVATTYENLKITSVVYTVAPASGGTIYPTVNYSGTEIKVYLSGKREEKPFSWNTTALETVNGKAFGGAVFNYGGTLGAIYVPSLGQNTTNSMTLVGEIYSLSVNVHCQTLTWNETVQAQQRENTKTSKYSIPTLEASYTDIGADGSAAVLVIKWTQTLTETWKADSTPKETPLSGTINNAATSGNYITELGGREYLSGASLVTTEGSSSRGNVTAGDLGYTEKDRTIAYLVTFKVSVNGREAGTTLLVYQHENRVSTGYTVPEITSVSATDVGADGSAAVLTVAYSQFYGKYSNARPTGDTTSVGGTTTPSAISGEAMANNATKDGVTVKADNLGTTPKQRMVVFRINSVTIKANDMESAPYTKQVDVRQQANKVERTEYGGYSVSVSHSESGAVPSDGKTVTIYVESYQSAEDVYTSKARKPKNVEKTATLSATGDPVLKFGTTSISGKGSTTLVIPENIGDARTITVTATAEDGKTKDSTSISQEKVRYSFYSDKLALAVPSTGGETMLYVVSTRNDKPLEVLANDITISGVSGASVKSIEEVGGGEYRITIQGIPANTTSSERTITVTAKQQYSGLDAVTWDVKQLAPSQIIGKAKTSATAFYVDNTFKQVTYSLYFDASDTVKYEGGTLKNVYVEVHSTINGSKVITAQTEILKSLEVPRGSVSATYSGTLNLSVVGGLDEFVVRYDSVEQFRTLVFDINDKG